MKTSKKAARIGSDQLAAGIAVASANAKSRLQNLSCQETDGVSGGALADFAKEAVSVGSVIDIGGTTTQGMAPPDDGPFSGSDLFGGND